MENRNTEQIETSVSNVRRSLRDYAVTGLALGISATILTILYLGCVNTANELISIIFE